MTTEQLLRDADAAIERAVADADAPALERLAAELEEAAHAQGAEGRGLAIAAVRARASIRPATPAPTPTAAATEAPLVYAGFGRRVAAFLLDWLVLAAGLGVVQAATGVSGDPAAVLWIFGPVVYFTAFLAAQGATPGKQALGIVVRKADGEPVEPASAILRVGAQALGILLVLGFVLDSLWAIGDRRGRSLHDHAADTVVVTRGRG